MQTGQNNNKNIQVNSFSIIHFQAGIIFRFKCHQQPNLSADAVWFLQVYFSDSLWLAGKRTYTKSLRKLKPAKWNVINALWLYEIAESKFTFIDTRSWNS